MFKKKVFSILSSTAILLSVGLTPSTAFANNQGIAELEQERKELENKSNSLSDEIQDAEKEMNSLDGQKNELMAEIDETQKNISELIEKINEQEVELSRLEEEIEKLTVKINLLEEKIAERASVLATQARGIQTGGTPENLLDLILSSESLTELIGKIEVVNLVVKNNNTVMENQQRDQEEVKNHKESVDLSKKKVLSVKEELESNRESLEAQKASLDSKLAIVSEKYELTSSELDQLESNQKEIEEENNRLRNKIQKEKDRVAAEKARKKAEEERRKAAEEERKKAEANKDVGTSSSGQSSVKPSANAKGWARPSGGYVTSEFGYRNHPIQGIVKLHGGIDIGGGGPILAAKAGRVITAQYSSSWGNYVRIDHGNGIITLYAHMLSNLKVSVGQKVSQGQQLGVMGSTGRSTGTHLHFEVHENGRRVNPRKYVNF